MGSGQSGESRPRPRSFWRTRPFAFVLAVCMLLVAAFPLFISSGLSLSLTSRMMRDSVNAEVTTLRNASDATARSFLTDQESLVQVIASSPRLQETDDKAKQDLLSTYRRIHPSFRWLGLFTPDGRLVAASDGQLDSRVPALDGAIVGGLRGLHVSDAQVAHDDPTIPVVVYGAPVRDDGGRLLGVVLVEVDLHALILNFQHLRIRESGETYVIREDGTLITTSRFTQGAELRQRIESRGFQEARSGREGLSDYVDYRGIPVVGAYKPFQVSDRIVDSPRWVILSEVDLSEALAPVRRAEGTLMAVFLVLAGLVAATVALISRQVTAPLRGLGEVSEQIASGHFERRANEHYPFEFGQLARSFNRMAEHVETAIRKLQCSNDELFTLQQRFKLVVKNAPLFLFSVDADGVFTFAEGQALRHFAGEDCLWVGRHMHEVLRDAPDFAESLTRALAGEVDRDEIRQGDGVYQIWYSAFQEGNGNRFQLSGVAVDLTERKKLEALLAEAQRIARLGSWEWDLETNRLTWSAEQYRIFGVRPEEFPATYEAYLSYVHPEDRERVARTLEEAVAAGSPFDLEYRILRSDGEERILHSSGEILSNHHLSRAFGTAQDITERKRIEASLTRTLTQLNAQQEASLDGVLMVDDQQRIVSYNQRFLEIWRLPEDLIAQRDDQQVLAEVIPLLKDPEGFIRRVEALYANPMEVSADEIELSDGRVLERYTAPVISPDGTVFGRIWRFHDLTERRALENQLREQYSKLLELDQLKNDFVNAVSHDLRTPLTSILGYAEFLEDGLAGELNPEQLAFVLQIQKNSRRLEGLVNDLLDFARMEAGTFHLSLDETDLVRTIREVAESMRPQVEEAGLDLEFNLPRESPPVRADTERIERVVSNLLSNAVKFTPQGGHIVLNARIEDGCFVGEVTDTGIGISSEDIPRLFKRFSQLESGRRLKGGTGLGLSISKAIIEAHDGSIGVHSKPGEGSTFWFKLPTNGR